MGKHCYAWMDADVLLSRRVARSEEVQLRCVEWSSRQSKGVQNESRNRPGSCRYQVESAAGIDSTSQITG